MIPKQLFFIWFGDNKPNYVDYSFKMFKDMNNHFNVDLIYYTIDDVINCQDTILCNCKKMIFDSYNGNNNNKYYNYINLRIKSKFNFIQILSDIIRFEILYTYGGIYLDSDTFPIKKFDNNLLKNNSFSQSVLCFRNKKSSPKHLSDDYTEFYDLNYSKYPHKYHCYSYTDIYFVGLRKEYTDDDIVFTTSADCKNPLNPPWIRNMENTKVFKKLRKEFYNCNLTLYKDYIFYSHYILHLCGKKWQNDYKNSPMYCEYDDYLYGG